MECIGLTVWYVLLAILMESSFTLYALAVVSVMAPAVTSLPLPSLFSVKGSSCGMAPF